jgi:hypothetical protein
MKKMTNPAKAAILLTGLLWLYFILKAPTLDFDESLYRSVSESMKKSGNPWQLLWDGQTLYHKPPIFYWLICIASQLVDFGRESVSSLASRIPSFLSSIGILFSLYFGTKRKPEPALAYLCALFPVITGTAVIFDPLQTLVLMPALLIPLRLFQEERDLSITDFLLMAISLALASSVKGLNGIIIPSFAFGLHLLFQISRFSVRRVLRIGLQYLALTVIPAALFTAAFYALLHQKIGPAFTQEFIWVQHFARGSSAMEAHSGGVMYHPLTLFLGAGFLAPFLIYQVYQKRPNYLKWGYPLTYSFSFVLVFSFSATKLPHYTWPAWSGLALFTGLLARMKPADNEPKTLDRRIGFLASLPVFFLGVFFLLLGTAPPLLLDALPKSAQVQTLLESLPPFSLFQRALFFSGALSCFVFQVRRREVTKNLDLTVLFASIASASLGIGILPSVQALMVTPFQEIAVTLKARHPNPQDCIRYTGPLSASLSLELAPELVHNRCDLSTARYLIAPSWKERDCLNENFEIIDRKSYLVLCVRK